MTMSTSLPSTVGELFSVTMPALISDMNELWEAVAAFTAVAGYRAVEMALIDTEIVSVNIGIEVIGLTAVGAVELKQITGARAGNIKVLCFDDGYITTKYDASKLKLSGGLDVTWAAGDKLTLVNRGGNPGVSDGYWEELSREVVI